MSIVVKVQVMIHAVKHSGLQDKLRAHWILQADFDVGAGRNKYTQGQGQDYGSGEAQGYNLWWKYFAWVITFRVPQTFQAQFSLQAWWNAMLTWLGLGLWFP